MADSSQSSNLARLDGLTVSCRPIAAAQNCGLEDSFSTKKLNIRKRLNLLMVILAKQKESIYGRSLNLKITLNLVWRCTLKIDVNQDDA